MNAMPRPNMPYLEKVPSNGKVYWYVRLNRKAKRVALTAVYGSPEFMAQYHAAITGQQPPTPEARLTIGWAVAHFMASPQWRALAGETRKQFSYQYARIKGTAGHVPLASVTRGTVETGRADRAATPSDANKFVAATRTLFAYAVSHGWAKDNPAQGIAKLPTSKSGEGFRTWADEDHAAFEARWPVGTMQRLAYELFAGTGLRRGDVHRFGPQHIKAGRYVIRTSKTGKLVEATVSAWLDSIIRATAHGEMVFLLTSHGSPFKSKQSFGNWFSDACRAAGVTGSAHGIRKSIASRAAEEGASEAELNAFFGWSQGSRESATYTRKANEAKMAEKVSGKLQRRRSHS